MDDAINSIPIFDASILDSNQLKKLEIVCKMMLNSRENATDLATMFGETTQDLYQSNSDEVIQFTKNLLMKIEPWKMGWEVRLAKLSSTFDDSINTLYGIVNRFHN
jgi:hypothetical protein